MAMFREMRRGKQQLSQSECVELLKKERHCMLGVLGNEGYPYVVPMNFFYHEEDGAIYFHCAKEGHKVDAFRACSKVSCCVCEKGVYEDGAWAVNIRSVIAFGRLSEVEDPATAEEMLRRLGRKYNPDPAGVEDSLQRGAGKVLCLKLTVEHMTGKVIHGA